MFLPHASHDSKEGDMNARRIDGGHSLLSRDQTITITKFINYYLRELHKSNKTAEEKKVGYAFYFHLDFFPVNRKILWS